LTATASTPPPPADDDPAWQAWGPYLTERQWGTVREDISRTGEAWESVTQDMARSFAYRWGEEGIAGICDEHQTLCLALALWNGKDDILKERLFGLSNQQGNHGEDVKECYYYLDNVPTHRYMRMRYRYPQEAFPYDDLLKENARRTRKDPEYELADTGIFENDKFFDIDVEVAKPAPRDICVRYTVHNRADEAASLHLLPTLWFRHDPDTAHPAEQPRITQAQRPDGSRVLLLDAPALGAYQCLVDTPDAPVLFTDNRSNPARVPVQDGASYFFSQEDSPGINPCFKDGINDCVVDGKTDAVYAESVGTKAAVWVTLELPARSSRVVRLRLSDRTIASCFENFDDLVDAERAAADRFYERHQDPEQSEDQRAIQRQAWAGLLWSKQYYAYDVQRWRDGEPAAQALPPRTDARNAAWCHMRAHDIILMPDKWEYPWFASWDLAFHCIAIAPIDARLAKQQLTLLLLDRYMHPDGQLPAYEWNFSDVNPPVQALAAWKIFQIDAAATGRPDTEFLQRVLHRLILNFTWWVNRQDSSGNNIFEGGFLGLDNIGVFDRSAPLPDGSLLEQADATSWVAMFALNLMRISMELALTQPVYEDLAMKFAEHFFYIAGAMANLGKIDGEGLWDDEDGFYYDLLRLPDGTSRRLKLRTIVGLTPLFAVEVMDDARWDALPRLRVHLDALLRQRPDLAALVSNWHVSAPSTAESPGPTPVTAAATSADVPQTRETGSEGIHLFSILRGYRMKLLLKRMLDPQEFLSPHGIRSVSRVYSKEGFDFLLEDTHYALHYTPAESDTDMFGGNSNWRGPVWMPLNYLLVQSLRRFHAHYGDEFKVECPTGSGDLLTLKQIADFLQRRLQLLFLKGPDGHRTYRGLDAPQADNDADLLFNEYFDGDTGKGLGASHQTGWTALIALL
jgi:hypothetical protein